MKLLIVSDAWHPQLNGVVRTLENTARELRARGHEIEIVGPEKGLFTLPAPTYPEIRLEFFAHARLKRILDRFQPDNIHVSTEGPLGLAMRALCLRARRPFSTAYHTCFPEYLERRVPFPFRRMIHMLTYQYMKLFHAPSGAVMVATPSIEALLRKHRIKRLRRWSRGVDVDLFRPRGKDIDSYRDLPRPIFLYVGRVAVEKNLDAFFAARLPGTKVVIGNGPDLEKFRARHPRTRFLGRKTGEDLARHFAAADVFVFPSTTDTFGLVLLEALASGLPVAAYPVQGPRDILAAPEAARFAVLDEDLEKAAQAAAKLCPDPALCHAFVRERYAWSACAAQFLNNLQATTPISVRRLGRFSAALDLIQALWRRLRTLPKIYPNLYRSFSILAEGFLPPLLEARARSGKEDPERLPERFGHASLKRPLGRLIWCHGASLGEALSFLPLLERLRAHPAEPSLLLTTGTRSAAHVLEKRLPEGILHQYVPVDTWPATERFMAHWQPDLALITESELWPNLIGKLRKYAVPSALVNARISEESARRWARFAGLWIAALLHVFDLVLAQTRQDAGRFARLGAYGAKSVGNLKSAGPLPPAHTPDLEALKKAIGPRPLWLMASTHEEEEDIALKAAASLQRHFPGLLTVIVPRHPARAEKIVELAAERDLSVARRSLNTLPGPSCPVYLADTLGEMGLFYSLCPIACIAGSFAPMGGHNPVEAAGFGCAVLFGPDMRNFSEIAETMVKEGAGWQVRDAGSLATALQSLLEDESSRAALGGRAKAFHARQQGVVDRVMAELQPLLDQALA